MANFPELETLKSELLNQIEGAKNLAALEQVRIAALGKKGKISEQMAKLGTLPAEQRREFGQATNAVKAAVTEALEARKAVLEAAALEERLATERADITLPVWLGPRGGGRIHPVAQLFDEVIEIFADMGFSVAEGPDIDTDDYNFTKLNIPEEHPARQEHDTFYLRDTTAGDGSNRQIGRAHV